MTRDQELALIDQAIAAGRCTIIPLGWAPPDTEDNPRHRYNRVRARARSRAHMNLRSNTRRKVDGAKEIAL